MIWLPVRHSVKLYGWSVCESYRNTIPDFSTHLASARASNHPMRDVAPSPSSRRFGDFSLTWPPTLFSAGSCVAHLSRPHLIIEPPRDDYANLKLRYVYVSALSDSPDSGNTAAPFQATIVSELFRFWETNDEYEDSWISVRTNDWRSKAAVWVTCDMMESSHLPFFALLLFPLSNVNDPPHRSTYYSMLK